MAPQKIKKERKIEDKVLKSLPPRNYRRAISNPNLKFIDKKLEDYEMKLTRSFPTEIMHRSNYLRDPYDMNKRMNECLIEALSPYSRKISDRCSPISGPTWSKKKSITESSLSRTTPIRHKKHKKYISYQLSEDYKDEVVNQYIVPMDEFPLYKILDDAIGDLAGLMNSHILKKPMKPGKKSTFKQPVVASDEEIPSYISQELDTSGSQGHLLSKGFHLYNKALPAPMSKYLQSKCTLWKSQNKFRPSVTTSLSVNVTSEVKEDTQLDKAPNIEDDETTIMAIPNNNEKLMDVLVKECTAVNTIQRTLNKWMFPFRISPKDFSNTHLASVRNNKYFMQTLTGSDKIMLNKRTSMLKLNNFLVAQHLEKVEQRQEYLKEEEIKRLRYLKIHGIFTSGYDEHDKRNDNYKASERPHIGYNSQRPIFNENPFSTSYKTIVKEVHRDVVLKEKEEEDVASIGEVSFVSSTSSFEKKEFNDDDTLASEKVDSIQKELNHRVSPTTGNQSCLKYMNKFNILLKHLEQDNNLKILYKTSERLMLPPKQIK